MKNGQLKLESHIPPPKCRSRYKKFNFGAMKVGQSFVVDGENVSLVRQAATQFKRRSGGRFDYTTRKVEGGYRLWRISPN